MRSQKPKVELIEANWYWTTLPDNNWNNLQWMKAPLGLHKSENGGLFSV